MSSIEFSSAAPEFVLDKHKVIGSGGTYGGYGAPLSGTTTFGIKIRNARKFAINDADIQRVDIGMDIGQTAGSWQHGGSIKGGRVMHCTRGMWLRDLAEGIFVSDILVSDCTFGVTVDSGNTNLSNGQSVYCSIGLLVSGGANHAHGSVVGWNSRHNTYNLSVQNVTNGHSFVGCNFIAGQGGSDNGGVQIYNSKGVMITGGQIAYADVSVDATSQAFFRNVTWRGPVNISVSAGGVFDAKGCMLAPGASLTLNGAAFSGNTP